MRGRDASAELPHDASGPLELSSYAIILDHSSDFYTIFPFHFENIMCPFLILLCNLKQWLAKEYHMDSLTPFIFKTGN